MARDRADTRWEQAEEAWQRLQWARETHGSYASAAAFARAVGEAQHTYKAYERDKSAGQKASKLTFDQAVPWAEKLEVRWEWLLNREGLPWLDEVKSFSAEAQSVASIIDQAPAEQRPKLVEAIKTLLQGAG